MQNKPSTASDTETGQKGKKEKKSIHRRWEGGRRKKRKKDFLKIKGGKKNQKHYSSKRN